MGMIASGVSGRYTVTLKDSAGNTKFESTFENLLTDAALWQLVTGQYSHSLNSTFDVARLGTGTTPPAPTDTTMTGPSAFSGDAVKFTGGYITTPDRYKYWVGQYTFAPNTVVGTWSEVGLYSTDYYYYSRARELTSKTLIKDAQGNPTTITVAAGDYLYIKYEFRQYVPTEDVTGTMTLDGLTYNYTIRPYRITNNTDSYGWGYPDNLTGVSYFSGPSAYNKAVLQDPTATSIPVNGGTYTGVSFSQLAASPAKSNYQDFSYVMAPNIGNLADGISMIVNNGYQIAFTPSLPKNNENAITITLRHSLARL